MMIEDEELRNLFKIASEDHIQKIEAGLLHLEKFPEELSILEELLREAHSLKGDSRMLGVRDVETLIHQIEHIFGAIKRGETPLTTSLCDRLWPGLDAIRKLVHSAVSGEASDVNTFAVLAHLMGASQTGTNQNDANTQNDPQHTEIAQTGTTSELSPPTEQISAVTEIHTDSAIQITTSLETPQPEIVEIANIVPTAAIAKVETPIAALPTATTIEIQSNTFIPTASANKPDQQVVNKSNPAVQSQSQASNGYRIETIRVETRHLDTLMTQTGELTVTKIRVAHRLAEIEEILALYEEWSRDAFVNRVRERSNSHSQASSDNSSVLTTQTSLFNFHHRSEERLERLGSLVNNLRNSIYEDTARLDVIANELEENIRTLRLLPLSTIFQLFPRMVRDLARQQGKEVELIIEGQETTADKRILEEMKDPLMHMIRNSIDHGIETPAERQQLGKPRTATLRIKGYQTATNVVIEVSDDGRGLDLKKIKQTAVRRGICREEELATMTTAQIHSLIFAPGFSTRTVVSEVSGRGVGLDVVRTNVERLKGSIQVESQLNIGCIFRLHLGITLATAHVLIVELEGLSYALPVEFVETTRLVHDSDIFSIEGRDTILWNSQPISVVRLVDLLELPTVGQNTKTNAAQMPCIILKVAEERLGLLVDALLDEQDVILKPQSQILKRIRNVSGATILGTGEVCMVLNPIDLIKSIRRTGTTFKTVPSSSLPMPVEEINNLALTAAKSKPIVLLVEDSIATRTQEKRILENAGYEVVTAVDGLDGYNKLKTRSFDAVVSDIQMPNMDGLSLANKIRQHQEYNELPIILVTSLASDEDKRKGAEAGANAYITKGSFNQEVLLETLGRLI